MSDKTWERYRFKTKSVKDCRPIIFNAKYPWWRTGFDESYVTIVAYLPVGEDLYKYWDDAFDIKSEQVEKIVFSDRFPEPDYFKEDPES